VHEGVHEYWGLLLLETTDESRIVLAGIQTVTCNANVPDDGDDALELDSLERVACRAWATDFNDVVDAYTTRELLGRLAPVLVLLVVDDVVGAEFLQLVHLVL